MPAKHKATPELTDAEIFTMVGRAIFEGDDWPSRFGAALDLPKQTVRDIRRDHADLKPDVAAEMLAMIERRAAETVRARDALRAWLKKRGS
jgi:hypothetical protein